MYFKQLEIVGFKSFPHKTRLKFEPGVTAVVGPNGTGKSNIADAIRWVLGEQSPKSLRGASMEDVIFNGTDSIAPINMAEVSLMLSNENKTLPIDYDEVTITRRLFRSGESEYILNKTPVRLKDITSLFMGTGIGTDFYSIIEQGKIDLILSSKPEERRHIFEEASGITRYKSKKIEALRKLEYTQNNLVRLNDIITEVKRQISSIERHAKKAERYKVDFELMKELDLKLALYEIRGINGALEKNKEDLEKLRRQEKELKLEHEETLVLITKHRHSLDEIIQELTEVQRRRSEETLFIETEKQRIELNKERINDIRNLKVISEKEKANLAEKLRFQEEEMKAIKDRLRDTSKTKQDKESALVQKEALVEKLSREIETHQKDLKNTKNKTLDLLDFQTKTKNELIKLGVEIANRKSRLRRLETEKVSVTEERRNIESALSSVNNELNTYRDKVEKNASLLNEFKKDSSSAECGLRDITDRIALNENGLNSLKSKEEILKELLENFEGFDKDVKRIMDGVKNGNLSGVKGIVCDVIEPEKGYETALEVTLDKKAQAIIVDNKDSVKGILDFLGEPKGTLHFIIYEDIGSAPNQSRDEDITEKNGVSPLRSFVKVNPSYNAVADYLLDEIYVVENKDMAYEMLSKDKRKSKFVTKDGFFIEKGYIFGAFTKSNSATSIIGRTRKLEEIGREKINLSEEIERLSGEKAHLENGMEGLKKEIILVENIEKKEEIELVNILSKKESQEASLKKIDDELAVVNLEISEVGELIHEILEKGEELNARLNENETEHAEIEFVITTSQEEIQNKAKLKDELIFEISALKSEILFLENTKSQEVKNLDKETRLWDELKSQLEAKKIYIQDAGEKIVRLERETEDLGQKIDAKKTEEASLNERLTQISKEKDELSGALRNIEEDSSKKEIVLENLRDRIRNLEIKNRESELTVVNIKDRIREAYKVDIQDIAIQIEEGTNWEDVRNEIEVLKIKLEKIGPVNLVAIEEHKELEERFSFLTKQEEDLLRAKESLHKAITKIQKTARNLFIETFQKIQVEFKNYFRMLFGGGHAELLLLDEDVLEGGIEIVARPPGKKLQNLLLLSGGEKTLAAIALLFAIFKVKPSPFCLLDEVDAALDESNIGRFTRILHEFLKMSQFIVITHNKKTIQMANILYGITMEEKGVSKIVSVKFADDKNETPSEKEEVLV